MTFVTASEKLEDRLSFIRIAETLARDGNDEKAKAELQKATGLAKIWQRDLCQFEDDLARVSDSDVAYHGPGEAFHQPSVHAAVGSLGLQIGSMAFFPDYVVPTNLCKVLGINLSQLRAGLRRERARLAGETVWRTQADVARRLEKFPAEVKRLCDSGDLLTNGKTDREKRIDQASVIAYCEREGIAYTFGET